MNDDKLRDTAIRIVDTINKRWFNEKLRNEDAADMADDVYWLMHGRKTGIELITEQRKELPDVSIDVTSVLKFGPATVRFHEAYHDNFFEILAAASCYITAARATFFDKSCVTYNGGYRKDEGIPNDWPYGGVYGVQWNPSEDPNKNLQMAGALIALAMDRISYVTTTK